MKSELERLREQVKDLQARVKELEPYEKKEIQRTCLHDWSEPFYDTKEEPIYQDVKYGSDVYAEPTGSYHTVRCYSRICRKCGKKQSTTQMETVGYQAVRKPRFFND